MTLAARPKNLNELVRYLTEEFVAERGHIQTDGSVIDLILNGRHWVVQLESELVLGVAVYGLSLAGKDAVDASISHRPDALFADLFTLVHWIRTLSPSSS